MTDPVSEAADVKPAAAVNAEAILGLGPDLVATVEDAIDSNFAYELKSLIAPLQYGETADLIELLTPERRGRLVEIMRDRFDPEILPELDETVRDEVASQLGTATLAQAIARLESDDALYLLSSLEETKQRAVLSAIPAALRATLEEGLTYPEDSAGRLMQRDFVAVPSFWTVGETIDFAREATTLPNDFYDIFVVDPRHRPIGTVALSRLLRSKRPVRIADIMTSQPATIPVRMDQEEVAFVFKQLDLVSAPVVDDGGRLIGAIMVDDIVDVIEEEAGEDLMHLGGVREGDLYAAVFDTGKARFTWLFVNLLTAFLAAAVIGQFRGAIEQIVMLAVLMPIVASMGGNAGTQTLTVVVRALALKEVTRSNARRVLTKEILVGLFNGLLFAVLVGSVAWLWSSEIEIGLVIGAAMIVNMLAAGLAGTAIPLGLSRFKIDPALASGVFLTTVTDVVGFCAFLGLAAWLLL
ncbi:MAG: magnesium transporter [Alphaproteobacteria bacterium]|nr:magnesium transporter [Alphaproteobacteria bacterium]